MNLKHATWQGQNISVGTVGSNNKILIKRLKNSNDLEWAKNLSFDRPIGVIAENLYDLNGKVLKTYDVTILYKGQSVETLSAQLLNHPDIRILESNYSHTDGNMSPNVMYEKPPKPLEFFGVYRKTKINKSKISRKPSNKIKKNNCKCH